jgi:hypothetical protein
MTDHLKHIARDLENISLTADERQAMRQSLHATFQMRRPSPSAWTFLVRHSMASVAVMVLALAGTTTAMAHRSLPGDLLYPVRLAVNERIALAVTGGEDARLDLELRQIERSLAEEELVMNHELATFIVAEEVVSSPRSVESRQAQTNVRADPDDQRDDDDDQEDDIDLEAELRQLQRLLDNEEAAAELELSL